MKITFLGAAQEVTGSRYLIDYDGGKLLVDCGLFQGQKKVSSRNRQPFPVDPKTIDAVILTHAHIDHIGYVPALVKQGFKGPVYCSQGTYELATIMLIDSGFLQEEEARRINEEKGADQVLVVPVYTQMDAEKSLQHFKVMDYDVSFPIGKSLTASLVRSGHILGAAFVILSDGRETITFSGDLGRPDPLVMKAPTFLKNTDYLVLESTYGDRVHSERDTVNILGEMVNKVASRGGFLIIPAFAVGRTQTILYCLHLLKEKKIIPDIPIYLDSPMAIKVTELFCDFSDEHKLADRSCAGVFDTVIYARTSEESKRIAQQEGPAIIIAGSGMADGGRVSYHFKRYISDAKNMVLFVGFQAEGTEGYALVNGAKEIKIRDALYPVRASIKMLDTLSAHADYPEILGWLEHFEKAPKKVFITHGRLEASQSLQKKIEDKFGWSVIIPKYLDSFELE